MIQHLNLQKTHEPRISDLLTAQLIVKQLNLSQMRKKTDDSRKRDVTGIARISYKNWVLLLDKASSYPDLTEGA